jgi:hypothetical protein
LKVDDAIALACIGVGFLQGLLSFVESWRDSRRFDAYQPEESITPLGVGTNVVQY